MSAKRKLSNLRTALRFLDALGVTPQDVMAYAEAEDLIKRAGDADMPIDNLWQIVRDGLHSEARDSMCAHVKRVSAMLLPLARRR